MAVAIFALVCVLLIVLVSVYRRLLKARARPRVAPSSMMLTLTPHCGGVCSERNLPYLYNVSIPTTAGTYVGIADTGSFNAVFKKDIPGEARASDKQLYEGGAMVYHTGHLELSRRPGVKFSAGGGATGTVGKDLTFQGVVGLLPHKRLNGLESFVATLGVRRVTVDIPNLTLILGGPRPATGRYTTIYEGKNASSRSSAGFVCVPIKSILVKDSRGDSIRVTKTPAGGAEITSTAAGTVLTHPPVPPERINMSAILDTGTTAGITTTDEARNRRSGLTVAEAYIDFGGGPAMHFVPPRGETDNSFPRYASWVSNTPPQLLFGNELLRYCMLSYTTSANLVVEDVGLYVPRG